MLFSISCFGIVCTSFLSAMFKAKIAARAALLPALQVPIQANLAKRRWL